MISSLARKVFWVFEIVNIGRSGFKKVINSFKINYWLKYLDGEKVHVSLVILVAC